MPSCLRSGRSWRPPIAMGGSHEEVDASLVVLADLEQATRILRAICACEAASGGRGPATALRDELDLVRRRVLAGLGAHHGDDALERVSFQFAKGDGRSHALAVEWLDVTLSGTDRAAVALVEPGLSEAERLRRLTRTLPARRSARSRVLVDLITDPEHRWRQPWVQACAVHAAWSHPGGAARRSRALSRTGRRARRRWTLDLRGDRGRHRICGRSRPHGEHQRPQIW